MSGIQRKLKSMAVGDIEYFDKKARVDLQCIMTKLKKSGVGKWTATTQMGNNKIMLESAMRSMPLVKVTRKE
jgi:hypothetical protein